MSEDSLEPFETASSAPMRRVTSHSGFCSASGHEITTCVVRLEDGTAGDEESPPQGIDVFRRIRQKVQNDNWKRIGSWGCQLPCGENYEKSHELDPGRAGKNDPKNQPKRK